MRTLIAGLIFFLGLSPAVTRADWGANLASHFGFGSMGDSGTGSTQSRSMGTFDIQAVPGMRLMGKSLLAGLLFDVRFMGQLATDQGLQSFSGNGLMLGPAIGYENPMFKLLFAWDLRARHHYSGPDTSYKGSGIHLIFSYKLFGSVSADLEFVRARYNTVSVNEVESNLDESNQVVHKNVGFGLSYSY